MKPPSAAFQPPLEGAGCPTESGGDLFLAKSLDTAQEHRELIVLGQSRDLFVHGCEQLAGRQRGKRIEVSVGRVRVLSGNSRRPSAGCSTKSKCQSRGDG